MHEVDETPLYPDRPHPADYTSHQEYLRDITAHLKGTQTGFSYRVFSQKAGFSAPNVLKLAADGQRSIATRSIEKFAIGLGLTRDEQDAFEVLVHFSQARSDTMRSRWYERLLEERLKRARPADHQRGVELEASHFEVYQRWYALMLRELMLWPEFRDDPSALARLFRSGEVKAPEIERGLSLLQTLGLSVRQEDGTLKPAHQQIKTPPVVSSLAIRNFHRALLGEASEALDQVPLEQRNVSGVTLSLTPTQYQSVVERLTALRAELLSLMEGSAEPQEPRALYHLSLALFPITHPSTELATHDQDS